jgi:membrane associated rhomboid family serine protease
MSITLIIIIITCLVSFTAFNNEKIFEDLIFYPPAIAGQNQYYRFFTCGFIHANITHLAFNMYSLWIFGEYVEKQFMDVFGEKGRWLYLLMYLSALFFCLLPTYSINTITITKAWALPVPYLPLFLRLFFLNHYAG